MSHSIFYIDDSGTKEYANSPEEYSTSGNTRYFCFGGALMDASESAVLGSRIADLKNKIFGNKDVELKSNWLRIPKERKEKYLNPYNLSEDDLKECVDKFYDIVSSSKITLIAAIVDKIQMKTQYGEDAWYPPAVAYEILLQRIVQEVTFPDTVSVVIDDMDGATPKGNQYKKNLKNHHEKLRQHGSSLKKGLDWKPLKKAKFVNSAFSHHIQVADIVAYNVYRQFVLHGEKWENKANKSLPLYSWLDKLANKFRNNNGRIQGYGIIKIPLMQRVQWSVK